jgi:hypothetical protein
MRFITSGTQHMIAIYRKGENETMSLNNKILNLNFKRSNTLLHKGCNT